MKGYFARVTGCCGTTSVDLGLYSSIDMLVCANAANGTTKSSALNMNGLFLLQCKNLMPQLAGKSHAIAGRRLIGWDGIANTHDHVAFFYVSGAEWQHLARSLHADGNQRNTSLNRDVCCAFLKCAQGAVSRTAAFWKNQQRNAALADNLCRHAHCFNSGSRIAARHRDVTGAFQMPSEKGDLKQAALGEKPEL